MRAGFNFRINNQAQMNKFYTNLYGFGGSGGDGAYDPAGDGTIQGNKNYTSVEIDAARTITAGAADGFGRYVNIQSQLDIIIHGTLLAGTAKAGGAANAAGNAANGDRGTIGTGAAGSTVNGGAGGSFLGGLNGGASGGGSATGTAWLPRTSALGTFDPDTNMWLGPNGPIGFGGSGGGGAAVAGGASKCMIILNAARHIIIDGTLTLDGGAGNNGATGSGGGAAGMLIMRAGGDLILDGATITQRGGAGGNGTTTHGGGGGTGAEAYFGVSGAYVAALSYINTGGAGGSKTGAGVAGSAGTNGSDPRVVNISV